MNIAKNKMEKERLVMEKRQRNREASLRYKSRIRNQIKDLQIVIDFVKMISILSPFVFCISEFPKLKSLNRWPSF